MNVWNVHVVRAPFDGTVVDVEHVPGANRPAFSKDSDRNERVHVRFAAESAGATDGGADDSAIADANDADADGETGIETDREVTFVAGAFARRIQPYVEPGDRVERGERIGHIAFGSRVDTVFPPGVDIEDLRVEPGDRTTAGETVVLDRSTRPAGEATTDEVTTDEVTTDEWPIDPHEPDSPARDDPGSAG